MSLRLWWRDDDVGPASPALHRLLAMAAEFHMPIALAVVPAWLEADTVAAIAASPCVRVLQHGIEHRNHARHGEKKIELGGAADRTALAAGIRSGRERLARAFGSRFLPVMVPPWNRIAEDVEAALPDLGYHAVSTFAPRRARPVAGLRRIDTHLDLIDWRRRCPRPPAELDVELDALVQAQPDEPLGILGHHAVTGREDEARIAAWLAGVLRRHRVVWCDLDALFGAGP